MKLTVNKCLAFLGIVYVAWSLWISLTHPLAVNYLIRMYMMVLIYSLVMFGLGAKSIWKKNQIGSTFAYSMATFGVCQWMVDGLGFQMASFEYWIPLMVGMFVHLQKVNVNWLQGFLLGYWALVMLDLLTVDEYGYFYKLAHALGYEGAKYALSNYWVLLIAMVIYGVATKKSSDRHKIAPIQKMPRTNENPSPPSVPQRTKPKNRIDSERMSKDMK